MGKGAILDSNLEEFPLDIPVPNYLTMLCSCYVSEKSLVDLCLNDLAIAMLIPSF